MSLPKLQGCISVRRGSVVQNGENKRFSWKPNLITLSLKKYLKLRWRPTFIFYVGLINIAVTLPKWQTKI